MAELLIFLPMKHNSSPLGKSLKPEISCLYNLKKKRFLTERRIECTLIFLKVILHVFYHLSHLQISGSSDGFSISDEKVLVDSAFNVKHL